MYGPHRERHNTEGWLIKLAVLLLLAWAAVQTQASARAAEPVAAADARAATGAGTAGLVTLDDVHSGRLLFRTGTAGRFRPAPIVHTDVRIKVRAMIARVRVTQTFRNPGKGWVEGLYVFPLPQNAAVDHLRMRVGERVIEGVIKTRAAARRTYEKAKAAGQHAALVTQERPNIFTNAVANIGPGERIVVTIEYQQTLRYDQGRFHLRFPMVVAPRYIPGTPLASDSEAHPQSGSGWAFDTDQVPDAARITPPVVPPGHGTVNPVHLHVDLDAGFPLARLESNFASAHIVRHGNGHAEVTLDSVPADRDFELVWEPTPGHYPRAALFTEDRDGAHYALVMVMPPTLAPKRRLPRDVVFVIDTSGSMAGPSLRQAKAALHLAVRRLHPGDRFNIIEFNSVTSKLFPALEPVDGTTLSGAARYIDALQANGGTEMAPALTEALTENGGEADTSRVRQVIFLTDGQVGNGGALFDLIRARLGDSRLFTVGIGSAPNGNFMTRAARFGRGTYTYVGRIDQVQAKMAGLFRKLETPVLTHIEAHWPAGSHAESWPKRLPDLYAGEPVVLAARVGGDTGMLNLTGTQAGQAWRVRLPLAQGHPAAGIDVLWARRKIASLMDSLHTGADPLTVRREVTATALAHHLVSRYTALVAVDRTPARPAGAALKTEAVPVNLPHGWQYRKVFGRFPQTATAAPAWRLGGALALGLGLLLAAIGRRRGGAA